jgi:hypothetical protein
MKNVNQNKANGQMKLGALLEQARALHELTAWLAHQVSALERAQTPPHNGGLDLRASKITPDQLLDSWRAARGPKSEAFLLSAIYRRRAARRVAL